MKNLKDFKKFEITSNQMNSVHGGCAAAQDCARTAIRDGNHWLVMTCFDVLCQ